MTREEAKEILPLIKAFSEGKKILVKDKRLSDAEYNWSEVDDCSFNMKQFEYRIKPEIKYYPFASAKECWQEMLKHHPFGWVKDMDGNKFIIETVNSDGSIYVGEEGTWYFSEALENYTFDDGIPFGVKKEK